MGFDPYWFFNKSPILSTGGVGDPCGFDKGPFEAKSCMAAPASRLHLAFLVWKESSFLPLPWKRPQEEENLMHLPWYLLSYLPLLSNNPRHPFQAHSLLWWDNRFLSNFIKSDIYQSRSACLWSFNVCAVSLQGFLWEKNTRWAVHR